MIGKSILWFIIGILFWGGMPIFLIYLTSEKSNEELFEFVIYFISITIFACIYSQYYISLFKKGNSLKYFFLPVVSWILLCLIQLFQLTKLEDFIIFEFIKILLG